MLNQKLQLKLSQKLSPQQIQLMKLIQLTTAELEQKIKNEIEENPALEMGNEKTEIENDEFEVDLNDDVSQAVFLRRSWRAFCFSLLALRFASNSAASSFSCFSALSSSFFSR